MGAVRSRRTSLLSMAGTSLLAGGDSWALGPQGSKGGSAAAPWPPPYSLSSQMGKLRPRGKSDIPRQAEGGLSGPPSSVTKGSLLPGGRVPPLKGSVCGFPLPIPPSAPSCWVGRTGGCGERPGRAASSPDPRGSASASVSPSASLWSLAEKVPWRCRMVTWPRPSGSTGERSEAPAATPCHPQRHTALGSGPSKLRIPKIPEDPTRLSLCQVPLHVARWAGGAGWAG